MAEHHVDLVLTDINMPNMDGLQLLGLPERVGSLASGSCSNDQPPKRRSQGRRSCPSGSRRVRAQALHADQIREK